MQRERLVAVLLELWNTFWRENMNKIGKNQGFSAIFVGDIQLVREFPVSPFSLVKFRKLPHLITISTHIGDNSLQNIVKYSKFHQKSVDFSPIDGLKQHQKNKSTQLPPSTFPRGHRMPFSDVRQDVLSAVVSDLH